VIEYASRQETFHGLDTLADFAARRGWSMLAAEVVTPDAQGRRHVAWIALGPHADLEALAATPPAGVALEWCVRDGTVLKTPPATET
jgi:hypothetical protein